MREILFRGKRVDNGDWVEGFYIQIMSFGNEYHCVFEAPNIDSFNDLNDYKVIPETVGQFTGLLDKNGKMIFEGDIIIFSKGGLIYGEEIKHPVFVYYDKGGFYPFSTPFGAEVCAEDIEIECDENKCEIIGNIHDKPELLK